jgi:pyridoxal phosphate enzyme (YggS family)
MSSEFTSIAPNLALIRERIACASKRAGRRAEDITLVAVSKTFPAEAIRAAYEIGLRDFGENRVQEWETKQTHLAGLSAIWHLIGHLQSNKARRAARFFSRVDSVDSIELACKLDACAAEEGKRLPILIEVHLGNEETKTGATESDLPSLAEAVAALPQLELLGLMAIPPFVDDAELTRPYFRKLRDLRDALSARLGRPLPVLSMGMSHDFEVAIEEGATEIRVGTALFGGRQVKA